MTPSRSFFKGFLIGLSVFIFLNLFAAHLLSDCGLPALFGLDACADDISRAGFPLVFFEEGGFDYHSNFNLRFLIADLVLGIGFAALFALFASKTKK